MSRNPACRPGSSRATAVAGHKPNLKNVKSTIPKKGPPPKKGSCKRNPEDPKKGPRSTRTLQERIKVAQDYKETYDRRQREREEAQQSRRPQRAAAPVGGDARLGRECPPRGTARPGAKAPPPPPATTRSRPTSARQPASRGPAACSTAAPPAARKAAACKPASAGAAPRKAPPAAPPGSPKPTITCPKPGGGWPKSFAPGTKPPPREPPPPPQPAPAPAAPPVPERTRNLAESMNADIVQAEPLQPGTVDNIIIPPGAINSEKTTIVSIPQPEVPPPAVEHHSTIAAGSLGTSQNAANKSMQVISEALDEQDANEAAIVNSKLQDLQNARRDFVMAVANVGSNSLNLGDDDFNNILDITPPELMESSSDPGCPMPSQRLLDFSDIDEPCMPDYGSRHPVVQSAREYSRTRQSYQQPDEYDLLDPEYLEGCGLIGADDLANQLPVCGPTDNYTVIPRRRDQYQYAAGQVEELERFFDLENYPPCPPSPVCVPQRPMGPPPGREHLHPDLWEVDDPWFREPEGPDLIDWGSYEC